MTDQDVESNRLRSFRLRDRNSRPRSWVSLFIVSLAITTLAGSADDRSRPLLVNRALDDALDSRRSLSSTGATLRQTVADLQRNTGIAIVLDRRLDPSVIMDVATQYVTTREVLQTVAQSVADADVSFADHYVLIGPARAARRLQTLMEINRRAIQQLRRTLDADTFRKLVTPQDFSWPELAEPRALLTGCADEIGLSIAQPDTIPHDLWAAARLPALPFSDFATLVLNQYDLTFEITEDATLTLRPVPATVTIEQRHRVPSNQRPQVTTAWQQMFPDLTMEWKGSVAIVDATVETHETLRRILRGDPIEMVAAADLKNRIFTMKAQAGTTAEQVIASLRQGGIAIRIVGRTDQELVPLLQQPLEFDLSQSPGTEFFEQVFADWGAGVTVSPEEVLLTFP